MKTYSGSTERQSSQSRVPFQESHPHLLLNKPAQTRPLSIHTNTLKVICLPLCIRISGSPNEDNFSKISKLFQQLVYECIIKVVVRPGGAE